MLCKKEEDLNNFCGNMSPFSGQKDVQKLQGTSQIKSLKLLVFPCNWMAQMEKEVQNQKENTLKLSCSSQDGVRAWWWISSSAKNHLLSWSWGVRNRADWAKHPHLLFFPLQMTSATPPLPWKFISVLAQWVVVRLRRCRFHCFDLTTTRCTYNSGTAALSALPVF